MRSVRIRAVILAGLMMISVLSMSIGAGQMQSGTDGIDTGVDAADEIYVSDDGDAVLVYTGANTTDNTSVVYGLNTTNGLVYARATDPASGSTEIEANLTAVATSSRLAADGQLTAPKPSSLSALDAALTSRTTNNTSRADGLINATFTTPPDSNQLIDNIRTTGNVTTTATQLRASGDVIANLRVAIPDPESYELQVTEDSGTYTLSVERNRTVPAAMTDQWQNRSAAIQTIAAQYKEAITEVDGNVSVTIESYSFTEQDSGEGRLDIAYSVRLGDIESGLSGTLATSPGVSSTQLSQLARGLNGSTVNEIYLQYEAAGQTITADFRVDLTGDDNLAIAYTSLAAAGPQNQSLVAPNTTRVREQFAAQRAANLSERITWSGSYTTSPETTNVDFEYHYRATNWTAYVEELESRGIDMPTSRTNITATTNEDDVVVTGSAEIRGAGLFDQLGPALQSMATNDNATEVLTAFQNAGLQKTKLNVTADASGVTIESGAAFTDLTVLRDSLSPQSDIPAFTEVVGRTDNGQTTSYVRIPDGVTGNITESDIRSLPYVDNNTVIQLPGQWNRTFPTMNTDRARDFLNLQNRSTAQANNSSMPG